MAFEYLTNINAVIQALKDYNTTTSTPYLSNGLNVAVNNDNIQHKDITQEPPRADRVPAIYVIWKGSAEEYEGIGTTGAGGVKKRKTVTYGVYVVNGKHGGYSDSTSFEEDTLNLVRNVEAVFRKEFKLSNTAMFVRMPSSDPSPDIDLGESYMKAVLITLEGHYLFQ